jgi:hypothetical protein
METEDVSIDELNEFVESIEKGENQSDKKTATLTDSGVNKFKNQLEDQEEVLDISKFNNEFDDDYNQASIQSSVGVLFAQYDSIPDIQDVIKNEIDVFSMDYANLIVSGDTTLEEFDDKEAQFLSLLEGWRSQSGHEKDFYNTENELIDCFHDAYDEINIDNPKDFMWIISDMTSQSIITSLNNSENKDIVNPNDVPFFITDSLVSSSFSHENVISRRALLAKVDDLEWGLKDIDISVVPVEDNAGFYIIINTDIMSNLKNASNSVYLNNLPKVS